MQKPLLKMPRKNAHLFYSVTTGYVLERYNEITRYRFTKYISERDNDTIDNGLEFILQSYLKRFSK